MAESFGDSTFVVRDCALAVIGTGRRARDLREFRDQLATVHPGCVYHHFWGAKLRPQFESPEFLNDFADWASHGLHDKPLAERLAVIAPAEFPDTEDLRAEVLNVIEQRLDEDEMATWERASAPFYFLRSQVIVFNTGRVLHVPRDLANEASLMTAASVFYHFIDSRRRGTPGVDDFRAWLGGFGAEYKPLIDELAQVDPFFVSLRDLRDQLTRLFQDYFRRGEV